MYLYILNILNLDRSDQQALELYRWIYFSEACYQRKEQYTCVCRTLIDFQFSVKNE